MSLFGFGDPGINPGSSGSGGNSGQQIFDDILKLATLGTQTYLTNQAITNPRPATVTYAPNGQTLVATGGGALPPSAGLSTNWGALFSNPLVVIGFILALVLILKK